MAGYIVYKRVFKAHAKNELYGLAVYRAFSMAVFNRMKILGFSAIALLSFLCQPAMAQEKGWMLTQRSEYMGDQYIYVCKNGFKWVNPKAGANVVTGAPNWVVTMFNDKTKQYFQTTFEKWRSQMLSTSGNRAREMQSARWKKAGSATISGLKASKYVMSGPATQGGGKLSAVKRAACWVADDIEVPAPIADMLSRVYGMPRTRYFPLKVSYQTNGGQVKVALDTYRSSTCAIPANYFAKPQGYALASSQAEVLMDEETRQLFRDMAGDFGPSNKAPVRKATKTPAKQPAKNKPTPGSTADQLSKLLNSLTGK